jgi:hypothetical protein
VIHVNSTTAADQKPTWTWADLLSTYRFWGLLLLYLLAGAGVRILLSTTAYYFMRQHNLGLRNYSALYSMSLLCVPFGFYLAWAGIRSKPLDTLLFTGCLQILAAGGLAVFMLTPSRGSGAAIVAGMLFFWLYLGSLAVQLMVPALIAGALGSSHGFLVAFGGLYVAEHVVYLLSTLSYALAETPNGLMYVLGGVLLVGVICLLPIRQALFTEEPPPRGRSLEPSYRGSVAVALLTFIPFYVLYWIYRAYGEAAYLRPSRGLLSPRGAAWIWLVPLMGPILLMTLADHLDQRAASWGVPAGRRVWAIFAWSVFFPPVAIGMLQGGLNRLASHQRDLPLSAQA